MAKISFMKGLLAKLPEEKSAGTFYVTTDERAIYLDVDSNTRIRIGDFQEFENLEELQKNTNPNKTALYYISDKNFLAKWDGNKYVQINTDTGATDIEVVGEGNAVTEAVYSASTRKITLTKGVTYATSSDIAQAITELKLDETYEKAGSAAKALEDAQSYADDKADEIMEEVDKKVASITAGDDSITISGDDTTPSVAVKIDETEGNALKLVDEKGLRVDIPSADVYNLTKDDDSDDYAAVYHLTKNGSNIGTPITIAKDMVVSSGKVVNNPAGKSEGTYIELTLANTDGDKIYIDVKDLIEYVTSGSNDTDMVVIDINDDHEITATISDNSITIGKLASDVQTKINQAHTHTNADELAKIEEGDKDKWDAMEQNAKDYTDEKIQEGLTWGDF